MDDKKLLGALACRVCLSTDITNKIVMSCENGLLDLFYYCFGVQIVDPPRTLCGECAENINKFADFKKKCLKSLTIWKSHHIPKAEFVVEFVKNENIVEIKDEDDNDSTESSDFPELYVPPKDSDLKEESENLPSRTTEYSYEQTLQYIPNSNIRLNKKRDRILTHNKTSSKAQNTASCSKNNIDDLDVSVDEEDSTADKLLKQLKRTEENYSVNKKNLPRACKCGFQTSNKMFYKMHVNKCKTNKFFKRFNDVLQSCGLCKFTTKDLDVLCKHLDEHFRRNVLECQLCDYIGRDFAEMAYHRYTHQNLDTRMFCHKCYKLYSTPKTMIFHFRSVHLKKKGGLCFYCDDRLATLTGWERHELRKHNNDVDRVFYFCDCCGVKSVHLKKKGALCLYCNVSLTSIKGWKEHVLRKHSDDDIRNFYFCDCCGTKFVYRHEIIKHLRQRAGYYKVVCDECGAEFARQNNLRSHIRNKHTKYEIVKCPHCEKTMKDINLKKHVENVHGEKKYVCEICSENFRTLVNFKYHMLSHTKERPFKCEICGVDYKNKSTLYMHMMKHKGVKPHVCTVCSKGFSTRNQLSVHGSVHTKVRTVKCDHCDKSFHFKKRLLLHHGRMHPDIPFDSGKETAQALSDHSGGTVQV